MSKAVANRASRSAPSIAPSFVVERFTLDNGLRVVVSPDRSSPTVDVTLAYDVGMRSEPEGRTGFAHLFEHFMFQGSKNLPKGEFDKLVENNGGVLNGYTRADQTVYYEAFPSNALEVVLFAEADRLRSLDLTEESLRNQVDVVKEEIRVNVLNTAYGGFPWEFLPGVMFETFPNAHDGYGSFEDLEAATLDDAKDFFQRYYTPRNAVLAIAGDTTTEEVHELVERYFGEIEGRPAPERPDYAEPIPTSERRKTHVDRNAPRPALALGYRVPHPMDDDEEFAATVVLSSLLGDGEASRLYQRLVKTDRIATHLQAYVGEFGDAFGSRDPTMLEIVVYYVDPKTRKRVIDTIDEEVSKVAQGTSADEIERVTSSLCASYLWGVDQIIGRTSDLATLELIRGRPELINDIPSALRAVTPAEVSAAAAKWIDPKRRAVLEWEPGANT
jgi:predicted Zn-dependent peptidase